MNTHVSVNEVSDPTAWLSAKELLATALAGFDDDLLVTCQRISEVASLLSNSYPPEHSIDAAISHEKVEYLEAYIRDNLCRVIRINELATMIGFSRGKFCRAFKATFGVTAHSYITDKRVLAAARMMQETSMPLSAIALSCGLYDQSHLCNVFRKKYRVSPSVWRKRQQASTQASHVDRSSKNNALALIG